jgi:cell division protein FtsW
MFGLLTLGLLMIYSATSVVSTHPAAYVQSQAVKVALGLLGFLVASRVDYHVWCRWAPVLYLLGLGTLVLVVVPGLGHTAGNSRRWLSLGGLTLQPADFARAGLVVYLAFLMAKPKSRLERWSTGMLPCLLALGPVVLLVLAQPNLSTALAIVGVTGLLLVAGGIPRRQLFLVGGIGLAALPVVLRGYQSTRLANWSAYWFRGGELMGGNYQMDQSILAIGSGGVLGRGLGGSHQKWFFLPDAHTDFVFAIVGEELGLMGTLFTIAMVLLLVVRGLDAARRAPDRFGFLLAVGIAGSIAIYAGINLMVATGLFPTTGLPLPLVSYGGSAVLTMLFSLGVLTNIAAQGDSKLLVGIGDHDG